MIITPEYYNFDQLRSFGCPNDLLMQYVLCTKDEIDYLLKNSASPGKLCGYCGSYYDGFHSCRKD